MTFADACQTPALDLLLRLEDRGFDIVADGERLRLKPFGNLTAAERDAIAAHKEPLLVLVRHCQNIASREVA